MMKISLLSSLLVFLLSGATLGQVGPFFSVSKHGAENVKFMKEFNYDFKHPGIDFGHDDLERVKDAVAKGKEPWKSAWDKFIQLPQASANYNMSEAKAEISRGTITNNAGFERDGWAALYNAVAWYVTRKDAHFNKSASILNVWGTTLKTYSGLDNSLGTHGSLPFINAAEILKYEGGWLEDGESYRGSKGFAGMVYRVLTPNVVAIGQSNYGIAMIQSLLSISILLEDVVMWNYAMNEYQNDACGGIKGLLHRKTGQNSESGRDQAHAQFGLSIGFKSAKIDENQGYDLFGFENQLLLRGLEYTAKYNVNQTVQYDPRYARCNNRLVGGPWATISEISRADWTLGGLLRMNTTLRSKNKRPRGWRLSPNQQALPQILGLS